MNNQNLKIKSQNTKHFLWPLLLLSSLFSTSCKKDFKDSLLEEEQIEIVSNLLRFEMLEVQKKFGKDLLVLMNEQPKIKKVILDMCLEQEHGDYYVLVNRFLTEVSIKFPESKAQISTLNGYYNLLRSSYMKTEPIIFLPSAETRELNSTSYDLLSNDPGVPVDFIIPDLDNPGPGYTYPGYYLDIYNNLNYYQHIDEEFAWNHDVFVIGFEEDLPPESQVSVQYDNIERISYEPPFVSMAIREPGRQEFGGIIQVIDMNQIEHWISGKFEFSYYVITNGTTIKNRNFGKVARRHFRNQKWYNYDDFIGNWNLSTWGNLQVEGWRELSGGQSAPITVSYSPGQGLPNYSVTIPSKDRDKNLGTANVQFTDPCLPEPGVTTYQISHMNFRRETKN